MKNNASLHVNAMLPTGSCPSYIYHRSSYHTQAIANTRAIANTNSRGWTLVSHGCPWWSVYPHNNFSCDKCAKNIGNHLQIVGNHGQSPTITFECGRITNLWLTQGTISSSKGCHALLSPQCNALFTSIRNMTIRYISKVIPQHYRPFMCDIT